MPADWGILIVTLVRRRQFLARLMRRLEPQLNSRVNVYTLEDQGAETIGTKRKRLLEAADEPWLCFVDDDDLVSEDYVSSICGALDENPDVVGFKLRYLEDGVLKGTSMHSVQSKAWSTQRKDGLDLHYRTPNHLNPVRTEMARSISFKPMNTGEDADYSHRLFKAYPDMREVFIDKFLYTYEYRTPRKRVESPNIPVPE
jgi:hypothetical protein